jgi:hypothetical protein
MSAIFGPVIQQGYVVPDVDEAMRHWIARGVGPFFVERHIRPKGDHDGEAIQPDLTAAFAYSGEQQIEVIEQHDDSPSIYRDYLAEHPAGGLQHLAVWVESIPETIEQLAVAGHRYTARQRYGDGHAYLDADDAPGVMIQLMARSEHLLELMATIRAASIGWDGVTAPIRTIDWSTGRPVPQIVE